MEWSSNRKTALSALAAALAAGTLGATDMEHKAKVVATVRTAFAGVAEVTCDDPGLWTFDVSASTDEGRDVVTVRIAAPAETNPPPFGVYLRGSGAGGRALLTDGLIPA